MACGICVVYYESGTSAPDLSRSSSASLVEKCSFPMIQCVYAVILHRYQWYLSGLTGSNHPKIFFSVYEFLTYGVQ